MKLAIVGAGIFGCTAAIRAARAGHEVHVYDKASHILTGATSHNQNRIHQGHHYPRSPETVVECQRGLLSFNQLYAAAVYGGNDRFYAIADQGSKLNAGEYLSFLNKHRLPFVVTPTDLIKNCQISIKVSETSLNCHKLYQETEFLFNAHKINFHPNIKAHADMLKDHDQIIVAGYAEGNTILEALGIEPEVYQFEVVEKPILKIPALSKESIVVMDGAFCCVDPFPWEDSLHLMGCVDHAIWSRNVGIGVDLSLCPTDVGQSVNAVRMAVTNETRWPDMQALGSHFIPALENATHTGSMFTVRTVLQGMDETDARPTLVKRLSAQVIRIYSGKLPTAVDAANAAVGGLVSSHVF
jgi:hypothetical protein